MKILFIPFLANGFIGYNHSCSMMLFLVYIQFLESYNRLILTMRFMHFNNTYQIILSYSMIVLVSHLKKHGIQILMWIRQHKLNLRRIKKHDFT